MLRPAKAFATAGSLIGKPFPLPQHRPGDPREFVATAAIFCVPASLSPAPKRRGALRKMRKGRAGAVDRKLSPILKNKAAIALRVVLRVRTLRI